MPFSPVQRARKFSVVLGVSLKRPKTTRFGSPSPIETSKKTLCSTVSLEEENSSNNEDQSTFDSADAKNR